MRRIRSTTLALGFILFSSGFVQANEAEARAILERAIKAHGGAAALEKALISRRTDTGTQTVVNKEVPFISQVIRSLPDRVRLQIELNRKTNTTAVLDGNKGWQMEGEGPAQPLLAQFVREMREEAYVWWLTTLVPMLKSDFRLTTLPKIDLDGDPASGIKVSHKGFAETKLYFLDRNGFLVKVERRTSEGGTAVDKEYLYSNFKEFSGITLHTREIIKVNNRKFTEFTISNYSFPAKLGAGAFARP